MMWWLTGAILWLASPLVFSAAVFLIRVGVLNAPFSASRFAILFGKLVAASEAFWTCDERTLAAVWARYVFRLAVIAFGVAVACIAHRSLRVVLGSFMAI